MVEKCLRSNDICEALTGSLVVALGDFTTFSLSLRTVSFDALKYFFLHREFDLSLLLFTVLDGPNAFRCYHLELMTGFQLPLETTFSCDQLIPIYCLFIF